MEANQKIHPLEKKFQCSGSVLRSGTGHFLRSRPRVSQWPQPQCGHMCVHDCGQGRCGHRN